MSGVEFWSEEAKARLRALWNEGVPAAQIGLRMGVSKNAIVGKAHRMGLDARPSPINPCPDGQRRRAQPKRAGAVTLPPLKLDPAPSKSQMNVPSRAVLAPRVTIAEVAATPAPAPVKPTPVTSRHACCWPFGDPGTKAFRFCEARAESGRPYCSEHVARAYIRAPDARSAAA